MMKTEMKRLLDAKAAAAFLCISRATLYRLMQNNQIQSLRIGNRRLFDIKELNQFVDTLKQAQDSVKN